jgi:hypothetical protein
VGSGVEPAGVSFCCQGFEDGAAGARRSEYELGGFGRADGNALGFDAHPLDDPLDGFLDYLDAYPDGALRGGATLLIRGASTAL